MDQQTKIDIGLGLLLALLGGIVIWLTLDFPIPKRGVGVSAFPRILSGLLILFSAIIIFQALSNKTPRPPIFSGFTRGATLNVIVIGILIVYIALLQYLGFLVASILLLAALMSLFGERRVPALLSISIGLPVVLFIVFEKLAMVSLPQGILETLFY